MLTLTLISRMYCHLCDEMTQAIMPLAAEFAANIEILDVDADPGLETCYGEFVPVLLHGENELCRFVLDASKVRDYLGKFR